MNLIAYAVSVVMMLIGAIFALQGLRVLPSAVMYGKPEWVVIGAVLLLGGAALIAFTRVRGTQRKRP